MLRFTPSHEWIELEADGTARVGITAHAAEQLGDLVFVEIRPAGTALTAGESAGVVESVKAASDIYAPVAGEILEANAQLADAPGLVNEAPQATGWLYRLRPADPAALDALLDEAGYRAALQDGG